MQVPHRVDSSFFSSAYEDWQLFLAIVPLPRAGSYVLLTWSAIGNTTSHLTCMCWACRPFSYWVRIQLDMRFIVTLLITSLFVDEADSELSSIRKHNLYTCASYTFGVCSHKYSHPASSCQPMSVLSILIGPRQGANPNRRTHFGFGDN